MPVSPRIAPAMRPLSGSDVKVGGLIGQRIELTWRANLLALDWEEDFVKPFREPVASGGYVGMGKSLDGLIRLAAHTREPRLLDLRHRILDALLAAQGSDGYLGIYAPEVRTIRLWDLHEQAYVLMALLVDWECFGEQHSLLAAERLGLYLIGQLDEATMAKVGRQESWGEVCPHLAILGLDRALLNLYRMTGDRQFLDFVTDTLRLPEWDFPIVEGRFLPVEGHMYAYLTRCLAQVELYALTGDERLLGPTRRALDYLGKEQAMVITGTNSIAECWHSDHTGSGDLGETCATAYLIRLLAKLLCIQGDGPFGDWMERSIYNALFAAQSPDGRKLRYYAPFEGERVYWDRDTYCCPGNFRRIIGELPAMIAFEQADGLTINLYTQCELRSRGVTFQMMTDYPNSGRIRIVVAPDRPTELTLRLRRPGWCGSFQAIAKGEVAEMEEAGHFVSIRRLWKPGDCLDVEMAMPWRFIRGIRRQEGKVAVMRGPSLFCLAPSRQPSPILDPAALRIIPDSLAVADSPAIRPDGMACRLRASHPAAGETLEVELTEFPDPEGCATWFDGGDAAAVEDENLTSLAIGTPASRVEQP